MKRPEPVIMTAVALILTAVTWLMSGCAPVEQADRVEAPEPGKQRTALGGGGWGGGSPPPINVGDYVCVSEYGGGRGPADPPNYSYTELLCDCQCLCLWVDHCNDGTTSIVCGATCQPEFEPPCVKPSYCVPERNL